MQGAFCHAIQSDARPDRFPIAPHNPLLRALALLAAAALAAALLAVGFVVGAAVLAAAAVAIAIRRWRLGRAAPSIDPSVIEGEFTVVPQQSRPELPHSR